MKVTIICTSNKKFLFFEYLLCTRPMLGTLHRLFHLVEKKPALISLSELLVLL